MDTNLSMNNSFVQLYRNSINTVVRNLTKSHPDLFSKYGHPDNPDASVNHLGAINKLHELTAGQLQEAFQSSRNNAGMARIITLILRAESFIADQNLFVSPDDETIVKIARKISNQEFPPEVKVNEILRETYFSEAETEAFDTEELTTIQDSHPDITQENPWYERFPRHREDVIRHAGWALAKVDRAATLIDFSVEYPLTERQLTKLFTNIKTFKLNELEGLVNPNVDSRGRIYHESDIAKILLLVEFPEGRRGVNQKDLERILKMIGTDEVMEEARKYRDELNYMQDE